MTDPQLAITAPVFTVAGELSADLARDCVRLEIEESTEGLRTLRAHFVAVGAGATGPHSSMLYLDGKILDFGKTIKVAIGPDSGQRMVFDGVVSGLEAVYEDGTPPVVVVYAEDALMRLRMTRRMRTYQRVTDADLARQVADAHSLEASVAADGPRYAVVQQVNQSDLAFLRERARLIQAELWCEGRTLHFSTRDRRAGTRLQLVNGGDLLSVRVMADLAHQRSEVLVSGFDSGTAGVINARAGKEVVKAEASQGRTGPEVVAKALGPSTTIRFREAPQNGAEATAWARAELLRRARSFVTVCGTTRGSPDMIVGSVLELSDVGRPFDGGDYYVTRFAHRYDHTSGLRTRFEAERAVVNGAA